MKPRLLVLCLTLYLASSPLHAQNIQLGAKAGMAITNFVGDRDTEFDAKMNFVGGFPLSYPINRNLLLTPEIVYAAKGADALATVDGVPLELSFSVIYLEFPLLAKYVLSPRKRVSPILIAGPVVSWNIDARVRFNAVGSDVEFNDRDDSIRTLDYGVAVGGGVDFSWDLRRITVELRYTRGVSNLVDDDDDPKHNGVVSLTAGVGL